MEFPPTIYIGLGVIIAAVITGIISFINLVASKDQKTSEFRQNWIEELREDVCSMLAHLGAIGAESHHYNQIASSTNRDEVDVFSEYAEKVRDSHLSLNEVSRRVILRLNKEDDKKLIDLIKELQEFTDNSFEKLSDPDVTDPLNNNILDVTQDILKSEWTRVKRGEPSFWITKYVALSVVIASIFMAAMFATDVVDVTVDWGLLESMQSQES